MAARLFREVEHGRRPERRKDTLVVRKAKPGTRRGALLVDRMRGRGDLKMMTDEIMALTRGD